MLIKSQTGLVAVRRRLVAPRFGHAMSNPLFGGKVFGFAAVGALACLPKIDDISHAKAQRLRFARGASEIPAAMQNQDQLRRYGGKDYRQGIPVCGYAHLDVTIDLPAMALQRTVQANEKSTTGTR
jgi:hypothetical protein